jgi:putative addiction module component (TIGR02574 family)
MTRAQVNQLLELPLPERYELTQILWNSLEPEWSSLEVTDRERVLLDESIESHAKDPDDRATHRSTSRASNSPRDSGGSRSRNSTRA